MARFRNFRGRFKGGYSKAKSWAGRNKGQIMGFGLPFIAGVIVGMTNYDEKIPAEIRILGACLPIGKWVKGAYPVQLFCQGLLVGNVIQQRTGISLGGGSSGISSGWGL